MHNHVKSEDENKFIYVQNNCFIGIILLHTLCTCSRTINFVNVALKQRHARYDVCCTGIDNTLIVT